MKLQKFLFLIVLSFSMNSCLSIIEATNPYPLAYEPRINLRGSGPITVLDFEYVRDTGIQENEIKQTAPLSFLHFTPTIPEFVKGAVHMELNYIGYSIDPSSIREVSGIIKNLQVDDLGGLSHEYSTDINFQVRIDGNSVYSGTFSSKLEIPAGYIYVGLSNIVTECIEQFILDAQKQNVL